jgi:DNA-binding transcriptional ArsR family regulator
VFRKKKEDTVDMNDAVAGAANLLAEPARAAMLLELMSGRALPAGELAEVANVSPQTASGHLAKLVEGQFLRMEQQGRHRYYRLASSDVANAVEGLLVLTNGARKSLPVPEVGSLEHARTCYAHLAGWLGVQIADALQANGVLLPAGGRAFAVTQRGCEWFKEIGVDVAGAEDGANPKVARQCIDWTERRPHVAGAVGVAMYRRFVALKWIVPAKNTRAVRVTLDGKRELWKRLRVAVR